MDRNIVIAGAGIGGLTTALYLHKLGIQARIFEAVKTIREVGVGINLLPRATAIYQELGLLETLKKEGVTIDEIAYCNRLGQRIFTEPRGLKAGYPVAQIAISRGILEMILVKTVLERLGSDSIVTNHRLVEFKKNKKDITCYFEENDHKTKDTCKADVLIAADGFRSTVRRYFYPEEPEATWLGVLMWRGITRAEPFLTGHTMVIAGNFNKRIVVYPIQQLTKERVLINWVAEVRKKSFGETPEEVEWDHKASASEFIHEYKGWNFPWLDVEALIAKARQILIYPMTDKTPVNQWCFGNVALLGDAAHPMFPSGSNAGSQAIIDAKEIALNLKNTKDTTEALACYEKNRLPKVNQLILANRAFTAEKILQLVDERAPEGFNDIGEVIQKEEIEALLENYKKMAGFSLDDFK